MSTPAEDGNVECFEYQIFERANPNIYVNGSSPIYKAVSHGYEKIVEILATNKLNHIGSLVWNPIANLNLKTEDDCIACNRSGDSALHEAIINGHDIR